MKYLSIIFISLQLSFFSFNSKAQNEADSMLRFIRDNPSRSSLFLLVNDTTIASFNEDKMMPLASTVKIMVALEFAKQAAHNIFDTSDLVALSELEKYYIPNTDGNAYPAWIQYEKQLGNIVNDSAKLLEVAKGMIQFSSNANTEFLIDFLGLENINSNYSLLGIKNYTPIYPFTSALFLYQNPKEVKESKILKQIKGLTVEQYIQASILIHNQLKYNPEYKNNFRPLDLTLPMQKSWSSRLPASTTQAYTKIANVINNRKVFDDKTYSILAPILESVMQNPANQSWLVHAGMKGGSTLFVLTKTMYGTLKDGTRIEMSYFFNNLKPEENMKLQGWMTPFELKILSDKNFRIEVADALKM